MQRPIMKFQPTRLLFGCGLIMTGIVITQPALAQIGIGPVDRTLDRTLSGPGAVLTDPTQRRLDDRLQQTRRQTEDAVVPLTQPLEPVAGPLAESAGSGLEAVGNNVSGVVDEVTAPLSSAPLSTVIPAAPARPLSIDVDPLGQAIEKRVLVILAAESDLPGLLAYGLSVVDQRPLAGMGLVLLTLRSDGSQPLAELADSLRLAFPDSSVDYNHLYKASADAPGLQTTNGTAEATQAGLSQRGAAVSAPANSQQQRSARALRIGMIDSALQRDHPALRQQSVIERDFVRFEGERPLDHGTAVASLLLDASGNTPLELLAASVFFSHPGQTHGASTESLVEAIGWLASEGVDVINISLAGPANALLERIMQQLLQTGPVVVAAVGNHGPAAPPAYPAAYAGVLGVTAVDRHQKIFLYANHGPHVDFAAYGVGVRVADNLGGWRTDSGTSMAAPVVSVAVAAALRRQPGSADTVLQALAAEARDLGDSGYDTIFGHGLVLADLSVRRLSQN